MKRFRPLALLVLAVLTAAPAVFAQDENPMIASFRGLHDITETNVMQTARMLDDEMYAYRPTDDVRSAGELLAHIANAQFAFCSAAAGEASPNETNYEQTATTKADIIAALETGFAYCQGVYDAMSDADAGAMRDFFGRSMTASGILAFNSAHNYEHYGNLVTYMRMNDLVPPSSQQ